jgi:hypothetical protein
VPAVRDAADIVAAEIEQHQMLGALLGIGEQRAVLRVLGAVLPRGRVPAIGRIVTSPSRADEDFGARAGQREAGQIEMVEEGRGVDPPQRAIEIEWRQRERTGEALRQHHLKDVPRRDIVLRGDHLAIAARRAAALGGGECHLLGARLLAGSGPASRAATVSIRSIGAPRPSGAMVEGHTGATRNRASASRSKTRMSVGRTNSMSAGRADWVPGAAKSRPVRPSHRRNSRRGRRAPAAALRAPRRGIRPPARAAPRASPLRSGAKASRFGSQSRLIAAFWPVGAEHQIGREPDQAVAPARRAILDRFEQKVAAAGLDQLERRRDRRLGIGQLAAIDQSGPAGGKAGDGGGIGRNSCVVHRSALAAALRIAEAITGRYRARCRAIADRGGPARHRCA